MPGRDHGRPDGREATPSGGGGEAACELLARFVDVYVDGEFAEGERLEAEAHLSGCAACRRLVQERANLKALLRAATPRPPVPAGLRRRLGDLLDAHDARPAVPVPLNDPGGRDGLEPSQPLAPLLPGAAPLAFMTDAGRARWRQAGRRLAQLALPAVLLLLPLLGYWQGRQATPHFDVAELAETVVKHQRNLPVEVAGDQQVVRSWFDGKVPFAVRPPRLEPNASLRGGRLVNLGSREAAYLVYERPGSSPPNQPSRIVEKISVFVFDAQGMPLRASPSPFGGGGTGVGRGRSPRQMMIGSHEVFVEGTHGYSVAVFSDRGLGYVITGDLDEPDLLRLLAGAISSRP